MVSRVVSLNPSRSPLRVDHRTADAMRAFLEPRFVSFVSFCTVFTRLYRFVPLGYKPRHQRSRAYLLSHDSFRRRPK